MAPRDEEAVDKIFAGSLDNLPPLSSKVCNLLSDISKPPSIILKGCQNLHQLYIHRHAYGEEHTYGVGLPQDQGILQRKAWT